MEMSSKRAVGRSRTIVETRADVRSFSLSLHTQLTMATTTVESA
jgi:hypothetical protein